MQREILSYVLYQGEPGERTIVMRSPKARVVREAINLYDDIFVKNVVNCAEKLDEIIVQIVSYWDDLTLDDVYDGLPSDRLFLFIRETLEYIVGGTTTRIEQQKKLRALQEAKAQMQAGQFQPGIG